MPGYKHIQSVSRALDIVALVANSTEGLKLRQVALGLGVHKQTAHNLLRTLVHKGFIEKRGSPPRYRLGLDLKAMRQRHDWWNREFLIPAIPCLIKASREVSATGLLGQYVGGAVIVRFVTKAIVSGMPQTLYGSHMAPYGSALILQAFLDRDDLLEFRRRHPFGVADRNYWKSFDNIDRFLELVRQEGHLCFVKSSIFRAAAPVRDESGVVRASVVLAKPFESMGPDEPKRCIELLCHTARQISRSTSSVGLAVQR